MEELFKEIVAIKGVQSVIFIDASGKIIYESITNPRREIRQRYKNWKKLLDILGDMREADFVFDNGRVYLRYTGNGYLIVSMQSFASIAMVKLNCDILLPQVTNAKSKGLKAFFKR